MIFIELKKRLLFTLLVEHFSLFLSVWQFTVAEERAQARTHHRPLSSHDEAQKTQVQIVLYSKLATMLFQMLMSGIQRYQAWLKQSVKKIQPQIFFPLKIFPSPSSFIEEEFIPLFPSLNLFRSLKNWRIRWWMDIWQ